MSERESGFGSFLLGLGLGAVLGFLFAPEPGDATRSKLTRKLRGLRDLAAEKAGELGQLIEAGEAEDEADEPPAREAVERRLADAKRRRRGGSVRVDEEDEPVA
jgi:gas vesicle protein